MTPLKMSTKKIYISLGSNMHSRLDYLQRACNLIASQIGNITKYSKIYETPAWGFNSTAFLNACICVTTSLSTKSCLLEMQTIEKQLGRKKKQSEGYEARPIDLDIIYSSEGVFRLENLVVPHPLMQHRKFVLVPLRDIAENIKHPLLHKTTIELLESSEDHSEIVATNYNFKEN